MFCRFDKVGQQCDWKKIEIETKLDSFVVDSWQLDEQTSKHNERWVHCRRIGETFYANMRKMTSSSALLATARLWRNATISKASKTFHPNPMTKSIIFVRFIFYFIFLVFSTVSRQPKPYEMMNNSEREKLLRKQFRLKFSGSNEWRGERIILPYFSHSSHFLWLAPSKMWRKLIRNNNWMIQLSVISISAQKRR